MDARGSSMGPVEREVMALIMLIAQEASATKLALLEDQLERLPATPTEYLWTSYAVAVVHTMLQGRSVSPPTIERGLGALYKLFTRCKLGPLETTPDLFVAMIKTLLVYLPPLENPNASSVLTEDGRMCIVQCIGLLASRTAPASFFTLPTDELIEVAFLTVAYLLQQAEKEVARASRVQALDSLLALLRSIDNVDVVALLLPGVVAKLLQLTHHADYKWGSKVPAKALECLREVLFLGLRDSRWTHLVSKPEFTLAAALSPFPTTTTTTSSSAPLPNTSKPQVDRSRAWLETTQVNMQIALDLICRSQRHHAKPRVRIALVGLCSVVVRDCRWSLAPSFFSAFEALLSLSLDPILDVQTSARQALEQFHAAMSDDEGLWLQRHATARVVSHLRDLAKKCATDVEMEAEACATLQLVLAYDQSTSIAFDAVLHEVLRAMTTVLRIDHVDAHVLAHESRSRPTATVTFAYYRKRFVHVRSDAAVRLATQVLRRIGARGATLIWIDHLMAQLRDESERSTELLLVLNHFVLGAAHSGVTSPADKPSLSVQNVGYLLDQLLHLPQWTTLPMATHFGGQPLRLPGAAFDSEETTSVLLEILGSCAEALELAFQPLLMHVLYPIAEHLAGHSSVVHQAATATLQRLAFHCAYDDVPALLHGNMDYVIDMLCARLQQLDAYPHTPFVVEGLLAHAGSTPLPLLHDAVQSVLRSVDRYVSSAHSAGLLRVMKVIVTTAPPSEDTLTETPPRPSKLDAFLKEMKTLFDPTMGVPDDAASEAQLDAMLNENDDDDSAVLERKMKAAMPVEHEPEADASDAIMRDLVKDILVRSSYFMAAPDVATSCLASSVLAHAVLLLPLNDLRPVAARVWPAVLKRMESPAKPVVLAALHCLSALAARCGDFLADRFVSEAWPVMRPLLHVVDASAMFPVVTRHDLTMADGEMMSSTHSLTHQIHAQCLECLRRMCSASLAFESILMDVARVTCPMLRASASASLQEAARRLFLAMAALNGDALFPLLADLGSWALPAPPTEAFPAFTPTAVKNVKHPVSTSASTAAYTANARELLRCMHA
ncbi:hypothetical protein SPRG_15694 [Saprolegnia parasitica CBS 223.65]|uniref:Uncharacterized protein n=1 Tax=Saprolegnia parasitica (strain CBS 223.65) TaxID=695850 RepID=A0A067BX36_SAPPC|nr:hypothetical protein SPRG_15694 [Saprolegnia parasitica CBS 223.65]KDO18866.1 hypothetical protein SPRG_15694 [Saprolegnia parasitica CBS 223.65]|eukprot:XP_012210420.1 hypothetical protein SPRG_15694 [Saprolegnia parasitica CBS 223.65]